MHIGINAHLLSNEAGYRAAGIHGYIYNTLKHLPDVMGENNQLTAMVSGKNQQDMPSITLQRAPFDTTTPFYRIFWEQVIQPFQLAAFDLYHAAAFVAPVMPYNKPTVVTIYDLSFIHYPNVLSTTRRTYLKALTAHTVRHADHIIAISHSTANDIIRQYDTPPEQITVAPPGTDSTRYRPLPKSDIAAFKHRHNLPDHYWLFLGTLEPRKNLPTLLQAYAQLPPESRPPLVLGGGLGWDYQPIFETISAYHLTDDILLPGFIPADDLPLWYNGADVFVYPSIYEGFGIPPLEAMACGTPVIVADASSLPEVIDGTANLCVPPTAVEAWVAALTTALDDSGWRRQASASSIQAASAYTWLNTAQHIWASYQKVAGLAYGHH